MLTQAGAVEDLGDGTFLCKLRESPFYAESGGQITDSGELVHEESGAVAVLRAAYKIGDDQALLFEGSRLRDRRPRARGRDVVAAVPDDDQPHRDAPAAPGAARRARRPREAGRLGRAARQAAVRLHASERPLGRRSATASSGS